MKSIYVLNSTGSNKIEYLPAELFTSLTKLKQLYVYKNKITTIPAEIGNLQCQPDHYNIYLAY